MCVCVCACACACACVRACVRMCMGVYVSVDINIGPSPSRDTEHTLYVDNSASHISVRDESRPLVIKFKTLLKINCGLSPVVLS